MAMGRGKPMAACSKISLLTATYSKEGLYLNFYLVIYKVKTWGCTHPNPALVGLWKTRLDPNPTNTLPNLSLIRAGAGWGGSPFKSNPLPSLEGEKGKCYYYYFLIVKVMVYLQREPKVDRSPTGHHVKLNEAWVWFKGPRPNGSNFFNILEDGNGYPVAKRV